MHHQKGPISFLLDPETDRALDVRAQAEGVNKPELVVEYIAEGLCLPEAVPPGGWQDQPAAAAPSGTKPRVRRTVYLDDRVEGMLSGRAGSEDIPRSALVDRFCREGLARPFSDGVIAARAKERLIAFHKARVAHFKGAADEASKFLVEEIAKFRQACPHIRVSATDVCEDCGAPVTRSP